MSDYYKYNFISPEPTLALIREELRSYLDTGAIDDLVWGIYIDKCLRKLGKGSYDIVSAVLDMCDFEARLPDDFFSVREAWLCTSVQDSYQLPSADYQQVKVGSTSTNLTPDKTYCDTTCTPDVISLVYKTTHQVFRQFNRQYLLKPGNINTKSKCHSDCANFGATGPESFDIRDNKFVTTFREGNVYLLYYSQTYDPSGYPLVPDDFRILEYIELFIKQKVFEQLSNQIVDETYNQIQQKAQQYKQMADEAFIMAQVESKKDTIYKKHQRIKRTQNSLNKYLIP